MKTSAVTILPLALLAGEMFFHPIEQQQSEAIANRGRSRTFRKRRPAGSKLARAFKRSGSIYGRKVWL